MLYAITGNKGLIGTFLKERLNKEGHRCVLAIDRREGFDINDLLLKEYELTETPNVFLHFAAQCRINEAIAKPILPHRNNVDGILSVLEFCRKNKIQKVVVASTSRILSPERNPYVASKIYCEELTKAYHDCYDLEYLIIRPSTVYGPYYDETSRLINNFLVSAFKNEDLRIYGSMFKTLDFTYIDDFVDGVMLVMNNDWNKTYNISGDKEVNINDLAKEIRNKVRSKSKIMFYQPEIAQPQQIKIDISEIKKLDYKPKVDIHEGIDRMIKFYKENPTAWQNYEDRGREFYKNGK